MVICVENMMKNLLIINLCVVGILLVVAANAQREYRPAAAPIEIESFIFSEKLWETKIVDFEK
ncbi:MAG: hypothetical protein ACJAR1_001018, partial [Rubritalea sp.]